MLSWGPTFVKKLLNPLAISSFFEILLLFFIKYSGHVGLFLRLLITSFSIFQVSLTFAFCFSNIELYLFFSVILNIDVNLFLYVLYFCSASADLITMNALYNLFFFVHARFKPLVNQVFFYSKVFMGNFFTGQCLLNISINMCRIVSYA